MAGRRIKMSNIEHLRKQIQIYERQLPTVTDIVGKKRMRYIIKSLSKELCIAESKMQQLTLNKYNK